MKKSFIGFAVLLCLATAAQAAPAVDAVAGTAQAGWDKNRLEGWIIQIDYRGGHFKMLDPRGFQKRVVTKPGIIGDYRVGDRVRVEIDPGYKRASLIEKLY